MWFNETGWIIAVTLGPTLPFKYPYFICILFLFVHLFWFVQQVHRVKVAVSCTSATLCLHSSPRVLKCKWNISMLLQGFVPFILLKVGYYGWPDVVNEFTGTELVKFEMFGGVMVDVLSRITVHSGDCHFVPPYWRWMFEAQFWYVLFVICI